MMWLSVSLEIRATVCSLPEICFLIFRRHPDYPADIRAPQGTLTGVSGFQVHIGSGKVYTPGDKCDVLVAMNPAALKTQYKFCKPQSVIIIDTDSFTKRDLEKAQFQLENPFSELGIKNEVVEAAITTMCKESLKDSGLEGKPEG